MIYLDEWELVSVKYLLKHFGRSCAEKMHKGPQLMCIKFDQVIVDPSFATVTEYLVYSSEDKTMKCCMVDISKNLFWGKYNFDMLIHLWLCCTRSGDPIRHVWYQGF